MTPKIDNDTLLDNIEFEEQVSRTYYLDREKNTITNFCDGIEAIKQAIYCILNTERFEHSIYSWNYGVEMKHLIGENSNYAIPELERVITEALLQDKRILEVNNFDFEVKQNSILAKFTVLTTSGKLEMDKAVSI